MVSALAVLEAEGLEAGPEDLAQAQVDLEGARERLQRAVGVLERIAIAADDVHDGALEFAREFGAPLRRSKPHLGVDRKRRQSLARFASPLRRISQLTLQL